MHRRDFIRLGGIGLGLMAGCARRGRTGLGVKGRKPNVLLIIADDMGFSDAGCYGSEIETPNLDRLAARGLRFSQHYSTGRCWPSRASILTGYYAQQVRRDVAEGIRKGNRPEWAPLLSEYLGPLGYRSYHSGKWHIDGMPIECGFDRSYYLKDQNRFFSPTEHYKDDVRLPTVDLHSGYYATTAIADHAVRCLKDHEKEYEDTPFFHYLAFTSPHFPLHALQKDIDRYRDRYKEGWNVIRWRRWKRLTELGVINCLLSDFDPDISPRNNLSEAELHSRIGPGEAPKAVPWKELTQEQQRFQALKMAIHAAMIDRMDREIGRVLDQLKAMDAYDDTVILFVSDNGASAEQIIRSDGHDVNALPGSAMSHLCLGPGWSSAANTPFRLHKMWNHEGGIASPLIVHWPNGIPAHGEVRHDPSHFIDIAPTILDLAGGHWPENHKDKPVPPTPGRSLVPAFSKDGAVKHPLLWWHHAGHSALREGDWKIVSRDKDLPWELYDLRSDRSETNDLAKQNPEKVNNLRDKWQKTLNLFREQLNH